MKNTNKKGFTLVELVIVIAVIAILAAVLIPTFTSVINRAKETKALQAARIAFEEYLVDLDYTTDDGVKASTASYIIREGEYAFLVTEGQMSSTAYKCSETGSKLTLTGSTTTDYIVDVVNESVAGLYATPVTNYVGFYTVTEVVTNP